MVKVSRGIPACVALGGLARFGGVGLLKAAELHGASHQAVMQFQAIPMSPTRLFIATNNPQTTAQFQSMPPRDLVMRMNKRVVRNAITYVWDTGLTNEALIKGQLGADAASDPRFF
jgi:hypothetical protein